MYTVAGKSSVLAQFVNNANTDVEFNIDQYTK